MDLPTLDARPRCARQKWELPTRLDEHTAADEADARGLEHFRRDVRVRDKGRCRVCGRPTKRTLKFEPLRGEAAHIARRSDRKVRHDSRNGLHMCLVDHRRFDAGAIRIEEGSARQFVASNGKSYIDGDDLNLRFVAA